MLGRHAEDRIVHEALFSWVPVAGLQVDFGLQLDALSMCFVLLITGVGSLIHIYSVGYMAEDPERRKFFAYLNLFLAAMLLPCSPTTTSACMSGGKAWVWRRTC